jgi:hypothetical protein
MMMFMIDRVGMESGFPPVDGLTGWTPGLFKAHDSMSVAVK